MWLLDGDELFFMFSGDLLLVGNTWSSMLPSQDLFSRVSTALEPFSVFTTDSTSNMKSRATLSFIWCSLMMNTRVPGRIRPDATQRAVTWANLVRYS